MVVLIGFEPILCRVRSAGVCPVDDKTWRKVRESNPQGLLSSPTVFKTAAHANVRPSLFGGPERNRTPHTLFAKENRQPWYMLAHDIKLERLAGAAPAFAAWKAAVIAGIRKTLGQGKRNRTFVIPSPKLGAIPLGDTLWRKRWDLNPWGCYTRCFSKAVR